jgi:hypothetical protein
MDFPIQFGAALILPSAFIYGGTYAAPSHKFGTALTLVLTFAIGVTSVYVWLLSKGLGTKYGVAWLVVCSVVSVASPQVPLEP